MTYSKQYCHVTDYSRSSDWYSSLLDSWRICDYTLHITVKHSLVFSATVFTALLGSVFQRQTFLCTLAHVLAGWRPSHTNLLLFWLPSQNCPLMKFKLYCDRRSVGQFVLVSGPLWGRWPDFKCLWVAITFFLLHVRHPLWREDGSVICSAITRWLDLRRTHNHISLPHLRLPQPGGPGPHIYNLQEQGGPVIPPRHWVYLYFQAEVQVILWPTVSRPVRLGWTDYNFLCLTITFFLLHAGHPLWREDESVICSAVTHWLESRRTHNHIFLSNLRLPQPGGPGPAQSQSEIFNVTIGGLHVKHEV
jgi:hypothetical protein